MRLTPVAVRSVRARLAACLVSLPVILGACGGGAPTLPSPAATAGGSGEATAGASGPTATAARPTAAATDDVTVRDGEAWVAYQWLAGSGEGMFLVRLDGTGRHRIAADAGTSQIHPDWSPDGSRLAFVSIASDGHMRLWAVDADGSGAEELYGCDAACGGVENPDWAPDGSAVYFGTYTDLDGQDIPATFQLGRYDVASGKTTIVLERKDGMTAEQGRISPDGTQVVYTRYKDPAAAGPGSAIFVADLKGGKERRLTSFDAYGAYPDWSTDNRIVFNTRDLGAFQEAGYPANLFLVDPDGGNLVPLTAFDTDPRATQPRWTPDGEHIVFTRVSGSGFGTRTMAVVASDGSGLGALVPNGPNATHPSVRPLPG